LHAHELHPLLRAMPKIELHRHLEGSLRLETLVEIAHEYAIPDLPAYDVERLRPHVQVMPDEPYTWENFLGKFRVLRQFFQSQEVIIRITEEAIADAAADNIKYMELRFTPQALNNLIRCDYSEIVEWVVEATERASAAHNIQVRLILSMNRHESIDIGKRVTEIAIAYKDHGVVGLDLAGQEAEYSAKPFLMLFERAKEEGLGLTIHAGEWAGADNVREAVELGVDRIGHGIHAIDDDNLVALICQRGTVLEVCPTSNVQSGSVAGFGQHPLTTLYQRGVATTVNTDDPGVCGISLSDEFAAVINHTPLTLDDLKRQTIAAARAAFLPDDQRAALVAQFESWLA
jgi:adenosine deaminase